MNEHSPIMDYIHNILGKTTTSVIYLEDYIEMSPTIQDQVDTVYKLYQATFTDDTKQFFVIIETASALTAIPAPQDLMESIFPDHLKTTNAKP